MLSSIKSIKVNYDAVNERKTFSSGDVLSGRVLLVLSKETKIEGLRVKVKGKAEVHWSERHLGENRTRYYSSSEKYFKLEQLVTGQEKGNDAILAAGSHVFPFTFQIPQRNMPPSFKGDHGKVEYKLEAKLSRSWRLPSNAASVFSFVPKTETGVGQLMLPQHGAVTKKMNLFTSGNAAINVKIEKMAYRPGERLKVTVDIQNSSSRDLAPKITVDQIQSFFAERRGKVCKHQMLKHVGKPVPANTKKMLTQVLRLPPNLPASMHNCRIIRVEYFLKVYLEFPFASDPEVTLPLVILPADFAPGAFPSKPVPAAAPPLTAPGAFPSKPVPGTVPPSTAPGAFPSKPAPAAAPPLTASGAFPSKPAPAAAPPLTAPGAFPSKPVPGTVPPSTAPGAFPSKPVPGAVPPSTAPGAFPSKPAPSAAPPPTAPEAFTHETAPGAFPHQLAPWAAQPPSAPGVFTYETAPDAAAPPTAPGAFLYQPPPGEPYTFLSYSSPDTPPAYDVLSQHSPQSPPSPPPSYSDAIRCPPPTAPSSSPPQKPSGTYPLR